MDPVLDLHLFGHFRFNAVPSTLKYTSPARLKLNPIMFTQIRNAASPTSQEQNVAEKPKHKEQATLSPNP